MASEAYVGAIDQGTTGTRFIVFNRRAQPVGSAYVEHEQMYPNPGWVEHRPAEIWDNTRTVIEQGLEDAGIRGEDVSALGITNQRETSLVWDAETGEALHHAVVWQDRRTADRCRQLRERGLEETVRRSTGLRLDPYFSSTKLEWMLDNVEGLRARSQRGEVCFGTVESWLIWKLTGGEVHVTDYSNASRTMLFDIDALSWDSQLLEVFDVPRAMMPEPRPNIDTYGRVRSPGALEGVPISGALGDQQAALFGEACFDPGEAKNTYGTGSFLLLNIGQDPRFGEDLLTSVGFAGGDDVHYVLEGSVFVTGAAIQWLRDELQIIEDAADTESLATQLDDNEGVYMVPAFTGLGAPHWDPGARGTIVGLTRGSGRPQFARAALESIVYQTEDVLRAMRRGAEIEIAELKVDGGAAKNDFICQFQSDISDLPVTRMQVGEATALGAAYAAGLSEGIWENRGEVRKLTGKMKGDRFTASMDPQDRDRLYEGWTRAVSRARDWTGESS